MATKFTVPKDFTLYREGDEYIIKIKGRNPIWVVLSCISISVGLIGLFAHPGFFVFIGLGAIKLSLEYLKRHTIIIKSDGFDFNGNKWLNFEEIRTIRVLATMRTLQTLRVQSGTHRTTSIQIEKDNGKTVEIAGNLTENYQKVLAYTLRQFMRHNEKFKRDFFE